MEPSLSKKERLIRYFREMLQEEGDPVDDVLSDKAEAHGKSVGIAGTAIRITLKDVPEPLNIPRQEVENQETGNGTTTDL